MKLADFGASKQVNEGTLQGMASSMKGTPYFMAPEVLSHEKYGRKADIWSLGGVAFQMATGDPPWKALGLRTPVALFYHIQTTTEGPPMGEEITSTPLLMQVRPRTSTHEQNGTTSWCSRALLQRALAHGVNKAGARCR